MPDRQAARDALSEVLSYLAEGVAEPFGVEVTENTPERLLGFLEEALAGYRAPVDLPVSYGTYDGKLSLGAIPFYSLCEHHLLPFFGSVRVTWDGADSVAVIGLSEVGRIVERFSRRLQIQERLTSQIADEVASVTGARSVQVEIEAEHLCVAMRGVRLPGVSVRSIAKRGEFREGFVQKEPFG